MKHAARSRWQICDNIAVSASGLARAAIYGARLNFRGERFAAARLLRFADVFPVASSPSSKLASSFAKTRDAAPRLTVAVPPRFWLSESAV
jgi:hypothetical protein